jgi:hypothetical protein
MARRLTLSDILILVAATAAGFALARACMAHFGWGLAVERVAWWAQWTRLVSNVPLALTLAYFPLRLQGPRPSFRRVARQPGTVASCAVVLAVTLSALRLSADAVRRTPPLGTHNLFVSVVSHIVIAHSVAAAWMAMWLTVGWQPRRDWVDAMGRILGVFWLVSLAFLACLSFL